MIDNAGRQMAAATINRRTIRLLRCYLYPAANTRKNRVFRGGQLPISLSFEDDVAPHVLEQPQAEDG
jgi:hypothetical protein